MDNTPLPDIEEGYPTPLDRRSSRWVKLLRRLDPAKQQSFTLPRSMQKFILNRAKSAKLVITTQVCPEDNERIRVWRQS